MKEIIKIKGVCKKYDEQKVLIDITVNFYEGKAYVIAGRSGSGKSTLLNICSFIENYDFGEVYFKGKNIKEIDEKEKAKIKREELGYIFQDFNLFEQLTLEENLDVYLSLVTNLNKDKRGEIIEKYLKEFDMLHKRKDLVKLLSGGERQRATVIRTLLLKKKIIFADEPSANIDDENVQIMIDVFKKLKEEGTTIIIVSHDNVFNELADEIFSIQDGRLIKSGC